jgi:hypothetical protein
MNLKKILRHHILQVSEGFDPNRMPDHKYYAFDWDDNVMNMPTKIIVEDDKGNEVEMSTDDFAEYRHELGKKPFTYNGKTIVGYAPEPFRNFRTKGDVAFLKDIMSAGFGPSWNDFVECINGGSIFAIITARGHNPNVLKQAVYKLINNDIGGIDREKLVQSLKDYREIAGEDIKDDDTMIKEYLNMCRFHPVSFGEGSAANPEEGKVNALREFISYVKLLSQELGGKVLFKNDIKNNFVVPKIGFSDDDEKNIEKIKDFLNKEFGLEQPVQTYLTKSNTKIKY